MNLLEYNQTAWDKEATGGGEWSSPVSPDIIGAARFGNRELLLPPCAAVPHNWFPELKSCKVLCLASGGRQQAPILAAAGANVTVLDCSAGQLQQDRLVAEQNGLSLRAVLGDMTNMHMFPDASFDLIVNPVSNCFIPDLEPFWSEALRVLRPGGAMLAGFLNLLDFLFDRDRDEAGEIEVRHALHYSDLVSIDDDARKKKIDEKLTLEVGHTLTQQIGGQLSAGFVIAGFYEDRWSDEATNLN